MNESMEFNWMELRRVCLFFVGGYRRLAAHLRAKSFTPQTLSSFVSFHFACFNPMKHTAARKAA